MYVNYITMLQVLHFCKELIFAVLVCQYLVRLQSTYELASFPATESSRWGLGTRLHMSHTFNKKKSSDRVY